MKKKILFEKVHDNGSGKKLKVVTYSDPFKVHTQTQVFGRRLLVNGEQWYPLTKPISTLDIDNVIELLKEASEFIDDKVTYQA